MKLSGDHVLFTKYNDQCTNHHTALVWSSAASNHLPTKELTTITVVRGQHQQSMAAENKPSMAMGH